MKKIFLLTLVALTVSMIAGCTEKNTSEITSAKKDAYHQWAADRVKLYVDLAQKEYNVGELDSAREKVIEAVKLDPDHELARLIYTKICIEQGDYNTANEQVECVIQKNPRSAEGFYLQGVVLEKQKKLRQALLAYEQSAQLAPGSIEPVLAAAEVMVGLDRTHEALDLLERRMKPTGDQAGVYELAGRLAMQLKKYKKAAGYFQKACDKDFKNKRYPEFLARAQMLAGRYDQAIRTLKRILNKREQEEHKAWIYMMLGDCELADKRYQEAFGSFRRATLLDRGNIVCWIGLSKAGLLSGQYEDALRASVEALKRSPNDLEANILCSYALMKTNRLAQAEKRLMMLEKLYPTNEQIPCLLGRVMALTGRHEEARKCFTRALKKNPDNQLSRFMFARAK